MVSNWIFTTTNTTFGRTIPEMIYGDENDVLNVLREKQRAFLNQYYAIDKNVEVYSIEEEEDFSECFGNGEKGKHFTCSAKNSNFEIIWTMTQINIVKVEVCKNDVGND